MIVYTRLSGCIYGLTWETAVMFRRLISAAAWFALLTTMPLSAPAQNNVLTASDMLDVCTRPAMSWVDFCNGLVQGVHDHASINGIVCSPIGLTRTELVELYEREARRLIEGDRSIGNKPAISVGAVFFSNVYPCQ